MNPENSNEQCQHELQVRQIQQQLQHDIELTQGLVQKLHKLHKLMTKSKKSTAHTQSTIRTLTVAKS